MSTSTDTTQPINTINNSHPIIIINNNIIHSDLDNKLPHSCDDDANHSFDTPDIMLSQIYQYTQQ